MKLDEATTQVLLHYIQSTSGQYNEQSRLIGATLLKNKIKQIYGVSSCAYSFQCNCDDL